MPARPPAGDNLKSSKRLKLRDECGDEMKVILTDDVVGLGDIGETVSVKPGYARNFLIPRGLATESETSNAKMLAHKLLQINAKKRRMKGDAQGRATSLQGKILSFEVRTGAHGRVFGSVTAREIAQKLAELGVEVDRRRVQLGEPLKKLGEHSVAVRLHQEVETEIKIVLTGRDSSNNEESGDVDAARLALEAGAGEKRGRRGKGRGAAEASAEAGGEDDSAE